MYLDFLSAGGPLRVDLQLVLIILLRNVSDVYARWVVYKLVVIEAYDELQIMICNRLVKLFFPEVFFHSNNVPVLYCINTTCAGFAFSSLLEVYDELHIMMDNGVVIFIFLGYSSSPEA